MSPDEVRPARRRGAGPPTRRRPSRAHERSWSRVRPGSSAAGWSRTSSRGVIRSCRSTTWSPATARTSPISRDTRDLRPLEVGDIRDAGGLSTLGRRGRRDRPPGRVHLGPGLDRRPGDDLRQRRRRHVQPARGRAVGRARFLFMSTCMVYDRSTSPSGIDEDHPTKPASPYAASKLAGEALTLSYHHAYGLPTTVVRPFNTYGPFQRSVGEGGVVAIFTRRSLLGEPLRIYGDGTQTRDLLYVTRLRAVRRRRAALRCRRRAGSSTRGPARTSRSTSWPRRSSRTRRASSTSSTSIHRARSPSCAAIRGSRAESSAGARRSALDEGLGWCRERGWRNGWRWASRLHLMAAGGDPPRDRRRRAGPDDAPAVCPPGHRRARHRGGHDRAPLRLADDRTTRPAVRERGLAEATGARHAVAFSSGTAALHGAAAVAGLGPGDEAITTPMTFVGERQRRSVHGRGAALRRCRAGLAAHRTGGGRGRHHRADAGDHPGRLRGPAGRLHGAPGHRGCGSGRAADDHRRRVALARRDVRAPPRRDACRHDRSQPPPGQDHDDGGRRRRPDRSRRPRGRAPPLPEPRHRDRARGPPGLDVCDGRARLQLPADGHRGRARRGRSSNGSRSGLHVAAGSRRVTSSGLAGHPALDLPAVDPRADPAWHFMFVQASARPASRRSRRRCSTHSAPRGSGSTSTTSPSIDTRSTRSGIPA